MSMDNNGVGVDMVNKNHNYGVGIEYGQCQM